VRIDASFTGPPRLRMMAFSRCLRMSSFSCGPCTAASRAAGRPRLPWEVADVPKVIRVPCPVRGMAGLSRPVARVAASLRLAACLRGVAFSSRSSLA